MMSHEPDNHQLHSVQQVPRIHMSCVDQYRGNQSIVQRFGRKFFNLRFSISFPGKQLDTPCRDTEDLYFLEKNL